MFHLKNPDRFQPLSKMFSVRCSYNQLSLRVDLLPETRPAGVIHFVDHVIDEKHGSLTNNLMAVAGFRQTKRQGGSTPLPLGTKL